MVFCLSNKLVHTFFKDGTELIADFVKKRIVFVSDTTVEMSNEEARVCEDKELLKRLKYIKEALK